MHSLLKAAVIVLAVVGAASLLNPSAERHRDQIKSAVAERSPVAAALRLGDLTAFVSSYHSLVVASYTEVNGRVRSVGALGVVVVLEAGKSSP